MWDAYQTLVCLPYQSIHTRIFTTHPQCLRILHSCNALCIKRYDMIWPEIRWSNWGWLVIHGYAIRLYGTVRNLYSLIIC